MFAAANLAFNGPDQAAVTALTGPGKAAVGQEGDGGGSISVVVTVVPLPAETIGAGSAAARLTSASPVVAGSVPVAVADLEAPPAAGPLSIRYVRGADEPAAPRPRHEVYSWTTGTWRALPDRRPGYGFIITPLEQDEVNDGLVRFRTRSSAAAGAAGLVLTSDEAAKG